MSGVLRTSGLPDTIHDTPWTILGRRTSEDGAELTVTSLSFGATADAAIQHWLAAVQPAFRSAVGEQPLHVYARHELTAERLL